MGIYTYILKLGGFVSVGGCECWVWNSRNSEDVRTVKSVRARAPAVRRFEVSRTRRKRLFSVARGGFPLVVSRDAFYRPSISVRVLARRFSRPRIRLMYRVRRLTALVFA